MKSRKFKVNTKADMTSRRKKMKKGIYILPNMVTTASLFCGFFSIVSSIDGHHLRAAWLILLAGIFDGLDGRIARITKSHSAFGIQYDSLCDLASFGIAPALLAYTWVLRRFHELGWGAAFLFFACGALRLARFNARITETEKKYFEGLPIPCAAAVLVSYVIFQMKWRHNTEITGYFLLVMTIALALLMVSNVRYRSFKGLNFKDKEAFLVLVGLAVVLFFVVVKPSLMIFSFSLVYAASGPVESILRFIKKRNTPKNNQSGSDSGKSSESNSNTRSTEVFRVIEGKAS